MDVRVDGCRLVRLTVKGDDRGSLVAIEGDETVPFPIARAYYVYGTQPGVSRGFHAHRRLRQLAIAVAGRCDMFLDDGTAQQLVPLDDPSLGLMIGPMCWREMRNFSPDCVLLVLASDHYDESDYIRDHDAFLAAARGART